MGKKTIKNVRREVSDWSNVPSELCVGVGEWGVVLFWKSTFIIYESLTEWQSARKWSSSKPLCWNREENSPIVQAHGGLAKQTALREVSQAFKAGRVGVMACFDFPIHQDTHCVWAVMSLVTSLCGLDGRPQGHEGWALVILRTQGFGWWMCIHKLRATEIWEQDNKKTWKIYEVSATNVKRCVRCHALCWDTTPGLKGQVGVSWGPQKLMQALKAF